MSEGLRIESAASVIARDTFAKYLHVFGPVLRADHLAGKTTHAEFVSALAGVCALLIAGGQGSKDDVIAGTIAKLREYVDRDLHHLGAARVHPTQTPD